MKLTSKELRQTARELVKQEREHPSHIYTEQEIQNSKHPNKQCQLCGQYGCDLKYAGQYLHKACYRKIKKITNSKFLSK